METFTEIKPFVGNPDYQDQKLKALKKLDLDSIDQPIIEIIKKISELDFCFTLQSCYGHFVYDQRKNTHNTIPLPDSVIPGEIEYRIAYIAMCLEHNEKGHEFLENVRSLILIDTDYIQVGCAEWFWDRQVNSFVIQVEPERFKYIDKIVVAYKEALHLEKIRNEFFLKLNNIFLSFI